MVRLARPLILVGALVASLYGAASADTHTTLLSKSAAVTATDVSTKHGLLSSSNRSLKKSLLASNSSVKTDKRAKKTK